MLAVGGSNVGLGQNRAVLVEQALLAVADVRPESSAKMIRLDSPKIGSVYSSGNDNNAHLRVLLALVLVLDANNTVGMVGVGQQTSGLL